ncbi:hypothetical protein MMAG44476_14355 [Mycolicibacterium mageritense DSM 44476 = CIP 104973]
MGWKVTDSRHRADSGGDVRTGQEGFGEPALADERLTILESHWSARVTVRVDGIITACRRLVGVVRSCGVGSVNFSGLLQFPHIDIRYVGLGVVVIVGRNVVVAQWWEVAPRVGWC